MSGIPIERKTLMFFKKVHIPEHYVLHSHLVIWARNLNYNLNTLVYEILIEIICYNIIISLTKTNDLVIVRYSIYGTETSIKIGIHSPLDSLQPELL